MLTIKRSTYFTAIKIRQRDDTHGGEAILHFHTFAHRHFCRRQQQPAPDRANLDLNLCISGIHNDALFIRFIFLPNRGDPRSAVQRCSNSLQSVVDRRQIGIAIRKALIRQIDIHR